MKTLRYLLFVALAALLLWLAFRGTDPQELWNSLANADYRYVLLSMAMGYVAYISRGLRWLLLLDSMGHRAHPWSSIHAVAVGYFANMAVPRAGELARCTALNRMERIPVSKLFGTVILERAIDFLMLFSFVAAVLLTSYDDFMAFYQKASGGGDAATNLEASGSPLWLFILLGMSLMVGLFFLFRNRILRHPLWAKVRSFLSGIREGLQTIVHMKKKGLFLLHTLVIWTMYFLMVYICIFAIPETAELTVANMLFVMVAAGMGMVVPVPGGVGAYHYLVVLSLGLLGINDTVGLSFATLVHSGQAIMGILTGLIALLFMYLRTRKMSLTDAG